MYSTDHTVRDPQETSTGVPSWTLQGVYYYVRAEGKEKIKNKKVRKEEKKKSGLTSLLVLGDG